MESDSSESELPDPEFVTHQHDDKSTVDYWILRGVKTVHRVEDVGKVKRRLNQIDEADRFHYLTCRDWDGITALYAAACWNSVEVADLLIQSVDSEGRDSLICSVDQLGETPLHMAKSSAMAQILLDALTPHTRQMLIQHTNIWGKTALHTAACRDRVEVADLIIRSVNREDREPVTNCVNDYRGTLLHEAQSSAMAQTLLDALTPKTKQQFIKRTNIVEETAALHALRADKRDVFSVIWTHSDLSTQLNLLQSRTSTSADSLLMWASWSGDTETVRLLLKGIIDSDSWEKVITSVNENGATATHQLILHQMADSIAEVLTPLTLEKRREHLAVRIKWNGCKYGYSSCELVLKPPQELKRIFEAGVTWHPNMSSKKVNNDVLKVLHLLTNEYDITSPASIIEYQLSFNTIVSHLKIDMRTSVVTVSISSPSPHAVTRVKEH